MKAHLVSMNRLFRITNSLRISWALLQTLGAAAAAAPPLPGGRHLMAPFAAEKGNMRPPCWVICGRVRVGRNRRLISPTDLVQGC